MMLQRRCLSITLVVLLSVLVHMTTLANAVVAAAAVVNERENADNHDIAASFLRGHYRYQQDQKEEVKKAHDGSSNFVQRLLLAAEQFPLASTSSSSPGSREKIMQALNHLMAAKQEQKGETNNENMDVVVGHLKSALADMHSFAVTMERNLDGRNLVENSNMKRISGAEFKTAAMRLLATGTVEKTNHDLKSLASDTNTVQQGIKDAFVKLHLALEQMPVQEIKDLSRRLDVAARKNENDKMVLLMDMIVDDKNPTKTTVPIVANTLARLLGRDIAETSAAAGVDVATTRIGDDDGEEEISPEELLALLWVMPVSIVAGTFFWAVAGLDTYDDLMTPFQIWIFEIVWVSRVIGCAIDNDFLCTAAEDDERSTSSSLLPFLPDEIQEDGPSL